MKMKRLISGFAAGVLCAVAMSCAAVGAADTVKEYTGLISSDAPAQGVAIAADASNNSWKTLTIKGSDIAEGEDIISYNATEFKKVLEIKDGTAIPAATFEYEVTAPASDIKATFDNDGNPTTLGVFKGIGTDKIVYKYENVNNNAFVTNAVSGYVTMEDFTIKYEPQVVVLPANAGSTGGSSLKGADDNVLINNINKADGLAGVDTYYAIKTVQMDFTACGFKEPGIYRYYIQETGNNVGIINDYGVADNSNSDEDPPVPNTMNCWRTLDVYVEDATYTVPGAKQTDPGTKVNALKIAGYVMYVGKQTAGPKAGDASVAQTTAALMEDGLAHTNPSGNGSANGVEIAGAVKSEGIRNRYNTGDLSFEKIVTGNQASRDKFFKFTLTLTGDIADKIKNTAVFVIDEESTMAVVSDWENVNDKPNDVTAFTKGTIFTANNATVTNGTQKIRYVSGAQLKEGYSFYLQDGQRVKINGLPCGVGYELQEVQDDYVPSVELSEEGYDYVTNDGANNQSKVKDSLNVKTGNDPTATIADTCISGDVDITFTNERKGTIPTGVVVSIAAPSAAAAALIGVLVVLHVKKKKED